jgi:hypothetical protein
LTQISVEGGAERPSSSMLRRSGKATELQTT